MLTSASVRMWTCENGLFNHNKKIKSKKILKLKEFILDQSLGGLGVVVIR